MSPAAIFNKQPTYSENRTLPGQDTDRRHAPAKDALIGSERGSSGRVVGHAEVTSACAVTSPIRSMADRNTFAVSQISTKLDMLMQRKKTLALRTLDFVR